MHPHYRGVAFLLSLGTLPIACGKDNPGDTADTGNGPTPASEGGESSASAGTTTAPVDPTTGPATTATTTTTTGDPDTEPHVTTFLTNNPTTGDPGETGLIPDFPPPMNPVCQGYADHLVECYPRYSRYAGYAGYQCDYFIMYGLRVDGQACADAIEAAFACFNSTPCDMINDETCSAENMAVDAACPSLQGPDTDTGTDTDTSTG